MLDLGICEDLIDPVDRPARNAGVVQLRNPPGAGPLHEICLENRVQRVAVLRARRRGRVIGIAHQRLRADGMAEPLPHRSAHRGDVDVAVARLEHAGRNAGRVVVAGLLGDLARIEPARSLEIEHEDLGLQKRGLDLLPLPRFLPLEQRDEDPERAEEPCGEVRDGNAHPHRAPPRLAGDRHETAQSLRDLIDSGPVAIGAVLAESGDARVDEPRVHLAECRIVDAQPDLHVGPEVLHHHVGPRSETPQHGDAFLRFQIDGDAALVAMQVLEVGAVARPAGRVARVEVLGRLDLDDVRSPVSKLADAGRSRADPGEIEHREAGQRGGSAGGRHGEGPHFPMPRSSTVKTSVAPGGICGGRP